MFTDTFQMVTYIKLYQTTAQLKAVTNETLQNNAQLKTITNEGIYQNIPLVLVQGLKNFPNNPSSQINAISSAWIKKIPLSYQGMY